MRCFILDDNNRKRQDGFAIPTTDELSEIACNYYSMLHMFVQRHYEYCSDAGYSIYVKDDICLVALYHSVEMLFGAVPDSITPFLIDWTAINMQVPKSTVQSLFSDVERNIKYALIKEADNFINVAPALALSISRGKDKMPTAEFKLHLRAFHENLVSIKASIDELAEEHIKQNAGHASPSSSSYRAKQSAYSFECKDSSSVGQTERPPKPAGRINFTFLLVLGCILLFVFVMVMLNKPYDGVQSPESAPTQTMQPPSLRPVSIENGHILRTPSYKCVCPFTVSVSGTNGYYVYLEYLFTPPQSTVEREHTVGSENDIAFYVSPGSSVDINVPIGVYKLYYASGETWYGPKYKFGDETHYFSSNDLLEFYADSEYYNGVTLELWAQVGGNYNTETIDEKDFP